MRKSKPAKVIVNGAKGKMGSLAVKTIEAHFGFELVAALSKEDELGEAIVDTGAEIVIDLTRADVVYQNLSTIIEKGAHPVIGTSGLLNHQIIELQDVCQEKSLGGIIVPNFSIAAVLMMQFSQMAARFLPDVEIIEAHHPQKQDAPSGTALKTAEMIHSSRKDKPFLPETKELLSGARGGSQHDIHIHSLRLPGILAKQEVVFGQTGETLTLCHQSIDRESFMPGLILACEKVPGLNGLVYGLEEVLHL